MATVREGRQGALLIVDVQSGVLAEAWDSSRIVGNIAHALQAARAQRVPVIWVQHENAEMPHGSAAWQWASPLAPADGEVVIPKAYNSSYEATTLDAVLQRLGVTHIVLAGASSNWCIRATAYAALERGYDLTLVRDGHTTEDIELGDGVTVSAASIVHELNTAFTWLRYPGRNNASVPARDLDFGSLQGNAPVLWPPR